MKSSEKKERGEGYKSIKKEDKSEGKKRERRDI